MMMMISVMIMTIEMIYNWYDDDDQCDGDDYCDDL